MKIPKFLRPGDTVAIIAPSGPVDPEKLAAGADILRGMGLCVKIFESCFARHEYLAGTDALRLRDLHAAFADREIRAVLPARGGYGAARLLPFLDFKLIRMNPKIFAGYSDITALHIALNRCAGLVTFHAPMPAADLPNADEVTIQSFRENLFLSSRGEELFEKSFPHKMLKKARQARIGHRGHMSKSAHSLEAGNSFPTHKKNPPLTGGNLTVIASLLGTPYEIDTRGRVLFLEEVGEAAYRVDRMFLQLKLAGKLRDAEGFVLGDFSGEDIELAVEEILEPEGKPIVRDFPAGHCMPNLTFPLGGILV
ncbi:MAG: LD-carboxypeptidase [Defluviitaleaceae bacterium]|nr:LD-carboxypeptidase [Defluviitaleaceae bacterium]